MISNRCYSTEFYVEGQEMVKFGKNFKLFQTKTAVFLIKQSAAQV